MTFSDFNQANPAERTLHFAFLYPVSLHPRICWNEVGPLTSLWKWNCNFWSDWSKWTLPEVMQSWKFWSERTKKDLSIFINLYWNDQNFRVNGKHPRQDWIFIVEDKAWSTWTYRQDCAYILYSTEHIHNTVHVLICLCSTLYMLSKRWKNQRKLKKV